MSFTLMPFAHINPTTISDAASTLSSYNGNAKIIAGGTSLIGSLRTRVLPDANYPTALVNIKNIPGLDYITVNSSGTLTIGTLTTLTEIANSSVVQGNWTALAQAAQAVGGPQLRNMGTIGGNLCQSVRCWYYNNPRNRFYCYRKGGTMCYAVAGQNMYHAILGGAVCFAVCPSDTAIALGALNATIVTNKRSMTLDQLFQVLGVTLANDEIITEIDVPAPAAGTTQSFTKFRIRQAIDFAVCSVASAITVSAGTVSNARIYLGGVAPVPYRSTDAENAIKGNAITQSVAVAAGAAAVKNAVPLSQNKYIVQITKTLVKRAVLPTASPS